MLSSTQAAQLTTEQQPDRAELPSFEIKPVHGLQWPRWSEVWAYRELVYFLAWRDIKVRYKQTALGIVWAVLQPLMLMLVFTLFFGSFTNLPTDGQPYALFALTGLVPWIFFSNGVTLASNSLLADAPLLKKVYFPRVIIPSAKVFGGGLDLLVSVILLMIALPFFGLVPTARWLVLPLLTVQLLTVTLGIGLWLAAACALFRDVRHVIPFLLQLWMFVTPVAYSTSGLRGVWQMVYSLNPMVGVVEGFRWMIFHASPTSPTLEISVGLSCAISLTLLATGWLFFRYVERGLTDTL